MSAKVEGECDPRLARVGDAFAENFSKQGEVGAAVAVTIDGRNVVDLWGGHRDQRRTLPWSRDTLVNFYSTPVTPVARKGFMFLVTPKSGWV